MIEISCFCRPANHHYCWQWCRSILPLRVCNMAVAIYAVILKEHKFYGFCSDLLAVKSSSSNFTVTSWYILWGGWIKPWIKISKSFLSCHLRNINPWELLHIQYSLFKLYYMVILVCRCTSTGSYDPPATTTTVGDVKLPSCKVRFFVEHKQRSIYNIQSFVHNLQSFSEMLSLDIRLLVVIHALKL